MKIPWPIVAGKITLRYVERNKAERRAMPLGAIGKLLAIDIAPAVMSRKRSIGFKVEGEQRNGASRQRGIRCR